MDAQADEVRRRGRARFHCLPSESTVAARDALETNPEIRQDMDAALQRSLEQAKTHRAEAYESPIRKRLREMGKLT